MHNNNNNDDDDDIDDGLLQTKWMHTIFVNSKNVVG